MSPELNKEVRNFLYENASKYLTWPEEVLEAYLEFYSSRAAMGIIREKGKIVGVGTARIIGSDNVQAKHIDRYFMDENGDCIFVDEICVTNKRAIPMLWSMMKGILGDRPMFAGMRHKKLKFWKFDRYEKKIAHLIDKE